MVGAPSCSCNAGLVEVERKKGDAYDLMDKTPRQIAVRDLLSG